MSASASAAGAERVEARTTAWLTQPWLIVGGLTTLALALRLACLGQSPFGDELYLFAIVHDNSLGDVLSIVHDTEKTPPLGFLLAWLFAHGDDADVLVRIPSLIASVATVPIAYLIGQRTFGRFAGTFAAAWLTVSPFAIFYGGESRSYALVTALTVLSTLALLVALKERELRWWVVYGVAIAAAVYLHYISILVLLPQGAWALFTHRDSIRAQLITTACAIAVFLPWLPSFLVQLDHSEFEAAVLDQIAPLSFSRMSEIAGRALLGHPFLPVKDFPGTVAVIVVGAAVLVGLVAVARRRPWTRLSPGERLRDERVLIVILAVAPVIGLALYSLQPDTSLLLPRNLSVAIPYVVLTLGAVFGAAGSTLRVPLACIVLVVLVIGGVKMLTTDYRRPDYRDAAEYVDASAGAETPVIDSNFVDYGNPVATGLRIQLENQHMLYPPEESERAWALAERSDSPVFVVFPARPFYPERSLSYEQYPREAEPPARYGDSFELASEHVSPGLIPIIVRVYDPIE
jgi:4-amino-4-deoxy-L-arabinose transferase-like glycosyltransferase